MTLVATVTTVANIISTENLHCTKLSTQLNISREALQRILAGKQNAGKGILSKLERFVQDYENGLIDIQNLAKPRKAHKAKKLPHVLKENEVYISGTDWKYTVDTDGQVYSVRYGRYLTHYKNTGGYMKVDFCSKSFYVHRLVGIAFIDNPENLPEINHKNGNKADNSIENLEWITAEDNIRHALLNGYFQGRGVNQIDSEGKVIAKYSRISEASRATGVYATSIVRCAKGKMKTSGGYRWEYSTIYAGKASKKKAGNISGEVLTESLIVW